MGLILEGSAVGTIKQATPALKYPIIRGIRLIYKTGERLFGPNGPKHYKSNEVCVDICLHRLGGFKKRRTGIAKIKLAKQIRETKSPCHLARKHK